MINTHFQRMILAVSVTLCLVATTGATTRAPSEAQKAFDAGEYRQALRDISKGLSLTAPEPTPNEKYELLMLRGDSLLRLGERAYACDAFGAATDAAPDFSSAATAKATAVLITLSGGPAYRPTRGQGEPIPIAPPESRAKAMSAAFEDLRDRYMPAIRKALDGNTLPPLLELVPPLGDMFVLELTSRGQAIQTSQILRAFGEHARLLMERELLRIRGRVASLEQLANSLVEADRMWGSRLDRRGLRTSERTDLQELTEYAANIRDAALNGRRIARSFGLEGQDWDPVLAEADEVLDHARTTWDRRY
jgi:hypothetical protein